MINKRIEDLTEDSAFTGDEWILVTDSDTRSKKLSTAQLKAYTDNHINTLSGTLVNYTNYSISTLSGTLYEYIDTLSGTDISGKADISYVDGLVTTTSGYLQSGMDSKATLVSGSNIYYTVGSGSQFETIKECFDYISGNVYSAENKITINLATQVHRIEEGVIYNHSFNHRITVEGNNQEVRVRLDSASAAFDLMGSGYLVFINVKFISESAVANTYLKVLNIYFGLSYFYQCTFTDFNWVVEGRSAMVYIAKSSITTPAAGVPWAVVNMRYGNVWISETTAENNVPAGYSHFVWGTENTVIEMDRTTIRNFDVGVYAEVGTRVDVWSISFVNTATPYNPPKGVEGNTLSIITENGTSTRRITSDGLNIFDTGYVPTVPLSPANKGYVDTTVSGHNVAYNHSEISLNTQHRSSGGMGDHASPVTGLHQVKGLYFNNEATTLSGIAGEVVWDPISHTLQIDTGLGNYIQVGQEICCMAVNKTGVQVTEGQVVYFDGVQGQRPVFYFADARYEEKCTAVGIVNSTIDNNEEGPVSLFGMIKLMNTSTWEDGDLLYVAPDATGVLTTTSPEYPNYKVHVATVAYSHNTQGKLFINTNNQSMLHNVYSHAATVSGTHGVVGDVVGTIDSQQISNKTFNKCYQTIYGTTTSGSVTISLDNGLVHRYIMDGDLSITQPNDPGDVGFSYKLMLDCGGHTPTFETSSPVLVWFTNDGNAPTFNTTSGKINLLQFEWDYVLSRWYGILLGKEV